jgi:GNAT superfamily N-acetyltransferase
MTITYQSENPGEFIDALREILPAHYDELCPCKDFPLAPDYEAFGRMDAAKMLRCITVREDNQLIGYMIFIVQPHLHYKTCLTAFEDIYYLKKEYRKGRVGLRLFQFAEDVLKKEGVNRVIMHTKVFLDNSRLFEYLGYKFTDKLFSKVLNMEPL